VSVALSPSVGQRERVQLRVELERWASSDCCPSENPDAEQHWRQRTRRRHRAEQEEQEEPDEGQERKEADLDLGEDCDKV